MNVLLWILQIVFGIYFVGVGVTHLILPEGLPEMLSWMYDLSPEFHIASGVAEIIGGLGLVLPGLTGIAPRLVVWAAIGLILVMVGAAIWHLSQDDPARIALNAINTVVLAFIAYGRGRLHPHPARG
jgi:uncharacterized membrane protein